MSKTNETRRQKMIDYLQQHNRARIKDLAEIFSVSSETIRKDMHILQQRGIVVKNHGWVQHNETYDELPIDVKVAENIDLKEKIARKAIELIGDHQIIYIDPGSTTLAIAKYLPLKKDLTVVTSSMPVAQRVLSSHHEIIFLGGRIQKKGSTTVGSFALENLDKIRIELAIMGTDGFFGCKGPTTFSYEELAVKRKVLQQSEKAVLVCDRTKFEKSGTYPFASFREYDALVTNPVTEQQLEPVKAIRKILFA